MAARKRAAQKAPGAEVTARPHVSERGEIALHLEGAELVLRPSHEAIVEFEAVTGQGLMQLTRAALDGSLSVGATAQIATECIKAWGRATNSTSAMGVKASRVAELILESKDGFRGALVTVAGMLTLASTGGYTASGELKPTTGTTTA